MGALGEARKKAKGKRTRVPASALLSLSSSFLLPFSFYLFPCVPRSGTL
jgi:hypothetical protein